MAPFIFSKLPFYTIIRTQLFFMGLTDKLHQLNTDIVNLNFESA